MPPSRRRRLRDADDVELVVAAVAVNHESRRRTVDQELLRDGVGPFQEHLELAERRCELDGGVVDWSGEAQHFVGDHHHILVPRRRGGVDQVQLVLSARAGIDRQRAGDAEQVAVLARRVRGDVDDVVAAEGRHGGDRAVERACDVHNVGKRAGLEEDARLPIAPRRQVGHSGQELAGHLGARQRDLVGDGALGLVHDQRVLPAVAVDGQEVEVVTRHGPDRRFLGEDGDDVVVGTERRGRWPCCRGSWSGR